MRKETYGRCKARRFFAKQIKEGKLIVTRRCKTVTWFKEAEDSWHNVVCIRYGRYTLRNENRK